MRATSRFRLGFAALCIVTSACSVSLGLDDLDREPSGNAGNAGNAVTAGDAGAGGLAGRGGQAGLGGGGLAGSSGASGASGAQAGQSGQAGSPGGQGGSGGASGTAGAAGFGGLGGGGNAGASGAAGGAGVSGAAGAAGLGGGAGASGKAGGGGSAGAAGFAGSAGGVGGVGGSQTCPLGQNIVQLHEVSTAADRFLDLHTNDTSIAFVSTDASDAAYHRPADLVIDQAYPYRVSVPGKNVVAARLRTDDLVVISPDQANVFALAKGATSQCGSGAFNVSYTPCAGPRLFSVDNRIVGVAGCGEQTIAPLDRTGSPVGGGICSNGAWNQVGGPPVTGGADETLGIYVRGAKVYTADLVGSTYQIVEKTWLMTSTLEPGYATATVLVSVTDGKPRDLIVESGLVYTSVRGNDGLWDIRSYEIAGSHDRKLLHTGIADLVAFTVRDGRVVFATGSGVAAGTSFFRGSVGGESAAAAKLVACAATPAKHLAATSTHLFWTDGVAPMGGKPAVRGVILEP